MTDNLTQLGPEDLIRGLKAGRRIAPVAIDDQLLDDYIRLIRQEQLVLKRNSPHWHQLQNCLREPGLFVKDDIKHLLNQVPIYVLPLPICICYSERLNNQHPIIVISSGLIDLLASSIFLAQLQSLIPESMNDFYFLNLRRDMDANRLLVNGLFLLQVHFYRFGKPLPNISALLAPELIADSKIAINGMINFILLHELGHHQLGHLTTFDVNTLANDQHQDQPLAVPETLDDYKKQEIAADRFALNSIKDEAKVVGTFWQQQSMAFFTGLELTSGLHWDREHPMSINRSHYSDQLRDAWGKEHGVASRHEHYQELAKRFESTATKKAEEVNAFMNTSHHGCWQVLEQLQGVYQQFGLDLSALQSEAAPDWLVLNQGLCDV